MRQFLLALALAVPSLIASTAVAQDRPTEAGIDMGLQWYPDADVALIALPAAQLRLGFPLGQRLTLEPRTQFLLITGGGTDGVLNVAAGLRYDFAGAQASTSPYVVALPEVLLTFGDGSTSDFAIGAGLGVQFARSERMAWRVEGSVSRFLDAKTTRIGGLLGATVYLP